MLSGNTEALAGAAYKVFYASAGVSLLCSTLTLVLIAATPKFTGYLGIIASLSAAQCLYDLSFLVYSTDGSIGGRGIQTFLSYFGGLSSSLWTNILSLLLVVIIRWGQQYNVKKNFLKMFAVVMLPSAAIAVAALASKNPDIFWVSFYIRIWSILFNVVCYIAILLKIRNSFALTTSSSTMSMAIRVLASRLKYYSLVQIFTRTPEIVYELVYNSRGYSTPDNSWGTSRWAAFFVEAILTPAGGTGFCLIFLVMQPTAWSTLLKLTKYCCFCASSASSLASSSSSSTLSPPRGQASHLHGPTVGPPSISTTSSDRPRLTVRVGGALVPYDPDTHSISAPSAEAAVLSAAAASGNLHSGGGGGSERGSSSRYSLSISSWASGFTDRNNRRLLSDDEVAQARLEELDDDSLLLVVETGLTADNIPAPISLSSAAYAAHRHHQSPEL